MDNISIVGIIVAALAFFFLGGAWYTVLFGKPWRAEMGISEEDAVNQNPSPLIFAWSILVSLVIAFTLAKLIGETSVEYGLKVGAGVGAGVGAAILAQNYVYEQKSIRFWLINAGYTIIGLGVMGIIIGAFQAP
ncbi:hypothetical protein J2X11_002154 [Aeromicrobium panaciterrae]|uniref:DUF1761 domain-containing protein n=1 Tax=Aeromicrobium panaciterrae TaxID=363861 RepID=A0ABU1UQ50_9ACTN|nr:DUF1761 domain-containing protein [Aeromicrobium panaciterrae]MDR7087315.1 hypothetical protein [Aeromicrobium panaciterrae]